MKFTWGMGIGIFYVSFMAIILGVVFFSTFHKQDLVTDDYYKEDLEYQTEVDKINRTKRLKTKPEIKKFQNKIEVEFPNELVNEGLEGKINFFRPSDKSLDNSVDLTLNESNVQEVNISDYAKGLWKVKLEWSLSDSTYFLERRLTF